ncbi:MAG: methyl-accepting chemotaxis protein [Paraglaciecola sp.]|nr:methyl-accepting chemotaxis protein [Paraglaciecola sp.]
MQAIRSRVRNKILLLLLCALSVIVITVFSGFSSMERVITQYSNTVNQEVIIMEEVATLNVTFKTQVQEWKNTLIRAQDPAQLLKYWGRFNKNASLVQQQYQQILSNISTTHPAQQHVKAFADGYPDMLKAYLAGYDAFIASGKNISIADTSVKGIDRGPTENLNKAVEAVNNNILGLKAKANERAQEALLFTEIVTLVVVVLILIVVSVFISKKILAPLKNITLASKQIAEGDFTGHIENGGSDEIAQVASNFVQIQKGLSDVLRGIFADIRGLGSIIENLFSAFEKVKVGLTKQIKETTKLASNMQQLSDSNDSVNNAITQANTLAGECEDLADTGQTMFKQNLETSLIPFRINK